MLNLAPGRILNDASGRNSPEEEEEVAEAEDDKLDVDVNEAEEEATEDARLQESLTMERFNSPLVDSQYRSTYAIVTNAGLIGARANFTQ